MNQLTPRERSLLAKLNSPQKIQDYISSLKPNFEPHGDECRSPREVMKTGTAHCVEAALVASWALMYHGHKPLLLDLTAARHDFDHVVALFKVNNHWGAISKSNHAVLRYRDPIYQTLRELALSYFHEYFDAKGRKTLISYSRPLDLRQFNKKNWQTDSADVWYIPIRLTEIPHFPLVPKSTQKKLRKADPIEIKAGTLIEVRPPRNYARRAKEWFL